MKVITADYLFPVSKKNIKNAYVVFDRENFINETGGLTVGNERNLFLKYGIRPEKLSGILCPGFVNAHCHLELSHLKTKVTPGKGLPSFLMEVQELKRSASEKIMHAMVQAEKEMERNGIVAVGDISNTPRSIRVKKKQRHKVSHIHRNLQFQAR
ncbi:MAG: amidohydrolase family protein [Bacteroidetes bacterium]|nr:amidohydrolase family protein [Bacteroidota bacterium]